jgi:hypothetical protein
MHQDHHKMLIYEDLQGDKCDLFWCPIWNLTQSDNKTTEHFEKCSTLWMREFLTTALRWVCHVLS